MVFYARFQDGSTKGRLALVAIFILLLTAASALVERPPGGIVAPPDRFIAVEIPDENIPGDAVSDRASFVVASEQFATEEPTTTDTGGSVIADPEATKYHADAVVKILDDKVHDGVGNGYALAQESHLVIVAHEDQSIAVKNLDEMTSPSAPDPVIVVATPGGFLDKIPPNDAVTHDPIALLASDRSIAALALDETVSDGGLAVDAGEILGGPFFSYHDARLLLRKTTPLDDGVDPTVQLSQARPAVVAPPDRFIAVEVPDENIPRGAVSDRASSHSRPIVIAADQYAAEELNMKDPGGSVVDPEAIDPAVQFTQGNKRSLQVLKDTDSTKKSMQVLRGTVTRSLQEVTTTSCTLVAAYNTDQSIHEVCKLTETLKSILPDAEPDASAIDVQCRPTPNRVCPIKPKSRRLVSPPFNPYAKSPQATPGSRAPVDTPRSLQHIATLSPTSTPSPGFILFNATSVDRNCSEIAAALMKIEGVFNVSVDIEGTTTMGRVSDNFIVYQTEQKFAHLSIELLHSNHRLAVILQIQFSPSLLSFDRFTAAWRSSGSSWDSQTTLFETSHPSADRSRIPSLGHRHGQRELSLDNSSQKGRENLHHRYRIRYQSHGSAEQECHRMGQEKHMWLKYHEAGRLVH
jgi:hypothetical protein